MCVIKLVREGISIPEMVRLIGGFEFQEKRTLYNFNSRDGAIDRRYSPEFFQKLYQISIPEMVRLIAQHERFSFGCVYGFQFQRWCD